jgi:hypothetical protein
MRSLHFKYSQQSASTLINQGYMPFDQQKANAPMWDQKVIQLLQIDLIKVKMMRKELKKSKIFKNLNTLELKRVLKAKKK